MDKKSTKSSILSAKTQRVLSTKKSKKEDYCSCGEACGCSSEAKKKNICDIYGNCS